jgi:hypothetical protein
MEQDIAGESRVSTDGSISTNPYVSKSDFPSWKSSYGPHLDIIRVEVLFGDAISDHHHAIPIAKEEVLGDCICTKA